MQFGHEGASCKLKSKIASSAVSSKDWVKNSFYSSSEADKNAEDIVADKPKAKKKKAGKKVRFDVCSVNMQDTSLLEEGPVDMVASAGNAGDTTTAGIITALYIGGGEVGADVVAVGVEAETLAASLVKPSFSELKAEGGVSTSAPAGTVLGPMEYLEDAAVGSEAGLSSDCRRSEEGEEHPACDQAALGRWAQLVEAMVMDQRGEENALGKALHQDLKDEHYTLEEVNQFVSSGGLEVPLTQPYYAREDFSSLDDRDGASEKKLDEDTHSMDAIFYEDDFMASKKIRKYKRKDWAAMAPPGGPRRSGRLRATRQRKFPSFIDLEGDSA